MDKQYVVKRIVSLQGKLDEMPSFSETPDGLIYSGTHTINQDPEGTNSDIKIDIESATVDGLLLPHKVRLRVNDNVDVRFTLEECSASKGTVVRVAPPEKN